MGRHAGPLPARWPGRIRSGTLKAGGHDRLRTRPGADRIGSSDTATAERLFIADTVTRTLRMIPGQPQPPPSSGIATEPIQLAGAWDRQGLLWVLAANPDSDYYQLGFWTGGGPLRTFAPAQGNPTALSAPGS